MYNDTNNITTSNNNDNNNTTSNNTSFNNNGSPRRSRGRAGRRPASPAACRHRLNKHISEICRSRHEVNSISLCFSIRWMS